MAVARFRILQLRDAVTLSWRLLATNNRDLGRAPDGYPDADACREAIRELVAEVDRAEPITVRSGPSSWSWRLMIGDRVVAVASRAYQRRIQAEQAAGIVLELIPAASLVGLE